MQRTTSITVSLVLSLIVCLTPRTSDAGGPRYELSAGTANQIFHTRSFDALSGERGQVLGALSAAYLLGNVGLPWFDVAADLDYEVGTIDGEIFQEIDSATTLHILTGGVRAIWPISRRTSLFGRLGLGLARGQLELDHAEEGPALTIVDRATAMSSQIGCGFDLDIIDRDRIEIGLRTRIGYRAMSAMHFRGRDEARDDGVQTISGMSADLGGLNLSAWNVRAEIFTRF